MFTVTIETDFNASHQLTIADGRAELLHEHNWVVKVAVCADTLDEMGIVVDFNELKAKVDEIIAPFKNARLEESACFEGKNTSAENVAKYVYDSVKPLLPAHVKLRSVKVTEARQCWAKYTE